VTTQNDRNLRVIQEFRQNKGKVGGNFAGAPMVLLTTTGAKTGLKRTTPLMCLPDGDRIAVFASKGGAPTHPAWYHNMRANPRVTVEYGTETFEADASFPAGAERDGLYGRQASAYPQFAEYEKRTTRKIPVVVLTRRKGPSR
jgi:deazaflavin-dependent oxidoreductase (nitroreductase family)